MQTIAMGIVHPGVVTYDWHYSTMRLSASGLYGIRHLSVQSGPLICRARNTVHDLFNDLPEDTTHLLWTDSDIYFNPEDVTTLMEADKDVVSGLYYSKDGKGKTFPVYSQEFKDGSLVNPEDPPTELCEVFGIGMGFALLKREVVTTLKPDTLFPFVEMNWRNYSVGEDVAFSIHCREAGFEVWIEPKARVGHRKAVLL